MRDKRGFLLAEETLKIVVAVVVLVFLIGFLGKLYFAKVNGQRIKEAEASLEKIELEINSLNEGDLKEIELVNPAGWYLFGFTGSEKKPNSCAGESCICICDDVLINIGSRQITKCDEKGVCNIVKGLQDFDNIKIKSPNKGLTDILIKKEKGFIDIKEI